MPAPTTGKPGNMSGPPPGYHPTPPYGGQPHFQQPPYGGPPPPGGHMPPSGGYMGWQGQQPPPPYGGPGAGWTQGQGGPPPMGMYRQGGPPPAGIDRGNWNGYRGGPPPPPPQSGSQSRRPPQGDSPPRQKSGKQEGHYWGPQWPQHQWGGGPPPPHVWQQGGPPPMPQPGQSPSPSIPQHMQGPSSKMWQSGRDVASPVRHPRRSPDTMSGGMVPGYPPNRMNALEPMCKSIGMGMDDADHLYMSREEKRSRAELDKEKGRGSYRCGRCGAPKKGHVCPYQPKLKRRPDEPPPEMRNAALQVEMDEFMTLRRLNLEIQGFPESYATAPLLTDNMVVGEPHPLAFTAGVVTNVLTGETSSGPSASPPPATPDVLRSSPCPSPLVEMGV